MASSSWRGRVHGGDCAILRALRASRCVLVGGFAGMVVALTSVASGQVARLGALGDSLTDEYSEETYSYAKNWTMQIVQSRSEDMGPTAAVGGAAGGKWGEPRGAGDK